MDEQELFGLEVTGTGSRYASSHDDDLSQILNSFNGAEVGWRDRVGNIQQIWAEEARQGFMTAARRIHSNLGALLLQAILRGLLSVVPIPNVPGVARRERDWNSLNR